MLMQCGVCGVDAPLWKIVDRLAFSDCPACGSIAMQADELAMVDSGEFERKYDPQYWSEELSAAKERSWGAGLARSTEALLLCRRRVERFLDIGCGPGYLLDALSYYLPSSKELFYGVEKFPPEKRSCHRGFIEGSLDELDDLYDCGVCIEVIEHLTPTMLRQFVRDLAQVSRPGSFFIFNTGLSDFVRSECSTYIDPRHRGHIVSWGFPALERIFGEQGFTVHRMGKREWAFAVEYGSSSAEPIGERIWEPFGANKVIFDDPVSGMAAFILARESLRADECQPADLKSMSYVPVLGLAKVKDVSAPLFPDGWMGNEMRAVLELRDQVRTVSANLWLPEGIGQERDVRLNFGDASAQQRMVGGMNTINLDVLHFSGEIVSLALVAESTFSANPPDSRQISVIVDSIIIGR